jgi:hypothetical protein
VAHLIIISEREEDLKFAMELAKANSMEYQVALGVDDVTHAITAHRQCAVFWDAENEVTASAVGDTLMKFLPPSKVFAVTDGPLNGYPHLFRYPAFGHHLFRRYDSPAAALLSKLLGGAFLAHPFGLERYFEEGTPIRKIQLKRSSQKSPAVEAVQNVLTKLNLVSRVAAFTAQATDELLMNAIFDAPVDAKGKTTRKALARDIDFALNDNESVQLEFAHTEGYIGIRVRDQFGSLSIDTLLGFLRKDYQTGAYVPRKNDPGAGLGLNGIIQTGMSVLFISRPGDKTEVMIFVARTENYKTFRSGFRFLSILSE